MHSTNKNRIYLVGFMGVGKSTIGKQLAKKLGYDFIDIDREFEKKYKISIRGFFDKYDEDLFRKLEYQVLHDSFNLDNVVVSTGGGTACFFNSIELMNEYGFTIYLEMSQDALFVRLKNARRKRPLVADKSDEDLKATISNKLDERLPYYQQAKLIVDAAELDVETLKASIEKH